MSYFRLTDIMINTCENFAKECVKTNSIYRSRGQSNENKIINDIKTGKMGEIASFLFLRSMGLSITAPDFTVYPPHLKKHSPDIYENDIKYSIKTQSIESFRKYGLSWIFEKRNIEKNRGSKLVLCAQISESEILILLVIPWEKVIPILKPPLLRNLHSKIALYYCDILLS